MTRKKINILAAVLVLSLSMNVKAADTYTDTYISEDIQELCYQYGKEYNICPELLMAIIERESSGKPDAQNGSCKGLMQINENVHAGRMKEIGAKNVFNASDNIHIGADYLAQLFQENDDDIYLVLMKYSMNHSKAEKLYDQEKYSKYAISVSERSAELERAHGY